MKHKHLKEEMIIDYLLGNLTSEDHFYVTKHLKTCTHCSLKYDTWQKYLQVEHVPLPSQEAKQHIFQAIKRWKPKKVPQYVWALTMIGIVIVTTVMMSFTINEHSIVQHEKQHQNDFSIEGQMLHENFQTERLSLDHLRQLTNRKIQTIHYPESILQYVYNRQRSHFISLQDGTICVYQTNPLEMICYQYDYETGKYYPIYKWVR